MDALRSNERNETNPLQRFVEQVGRKMKIFIVEDSDLYRQLLTRFVQTIDRDFIFEENRNYTIESFATGEECIRSLHQSPDIVILDYFLNGYNNNADSMDGMETLKQIKHFAPRTHVIIITSQGNMMLASEFIRNGASDYISKEPGVREKLQHSVARIMKIIRKQQDATDQ